MADPFHLIDETPGEKLYCACGRSKNKPYCDGSHGGTGISPWRTQVPSARTMKICGCMKTGIGPFCDDSHALRRPRPEPTPERNDP